MVVRPGKTPIFISCVAVFILTLFRPDLNKIPHAHSFSVTEYTCVHLSGHPDI